MKKILFTGLALLFISACSKKNSINPVKQNAAKVKVGTSIATGSGIKVTLYQDTTFLMGYNKVYLAFTDSASGAPVSNATAAISTGMGMGMGMPDMTCPVEQPVYNSADKMFAGALVFNMATGGGMGQWDITVNVTNPASGKAGVADFMVNVNSPANNPTVSVQGTDGQTYMITLVQPLKPRVGMNTLELLVDEQVDAMTYTPVNNFQVQFTPVMPAMDNMSSNNNQNPALSANGHYIGKVNLTMTGEWSLDINLLNGPTTIVNAAAITFTF